MEMRLCTRACTFYIVSIVIKVRLVNMQLFWLDSCSKFTSGFCPQDLLLSGIEQDWLQQQDKILQASFQQLVTSAEQDSLIFVLATGYIHFLLKEL